jgi:DNA (cytosine-5)-methyltransferase 1
MKILNLYAGIGGNRRLWGDHDVTAVEMDAAIADVYKTRYPNDTVVVGDAAVFLEAHYANYDFIWSSPPCPSHGQYRHNVGVIGKGFAPIMPDMTLYAQIVFLQHYAKGKWVVENVKPYYDPLVPATFELQRHLFWANFNAPPIKFCKSDIRHKNKISDFDGYEIVAASKIKNKRQVLRNCVEAEVGDYILRCANDNSLV